MNKYPITRLPNYPITQLPDYPITRLPDYPITQLPNYPITRLPDYPITRLFDLLVDGPWLRNEELLEKAHGVAVGHARDEIAGGGVEPLVLERARIEELGGALPDLLP